MKDRIYKFILILLGYPILLLMILPLLLMLYPIMLFIAIIYPEKIITKGEI